MLEAEAGRRYPKPDRHLAYGTAGFRARADVLDSTFFRMGMLAALRSRARGGLWVGLMVTASHNPEADNGIKLVDCDGGMLAQAWERHATAVANAPDDGLAAALASVADQEGLGPNQATGRVLIGRDTRSHSARLSSLASEGAGLVGSLTEDAGLVTTPQLHHVVRFRNYLPEEEEAGILPQGTAGTEETGFPAVGDPDMRGFEHLRGLPHQGYFRMLAAAFDELCEGKTCEPLWVDCAHGVGFPAMRALASSLPSSAPLHLSNAPGDGPLNEGCGAEHCQKARLPPRGQAGSMLSCSLDGDADRIVFHQRLGLKRGQDLGQGVNQDLGQALDQDPSQSLNQDPSLNPDGAGWSLMDGDKIAALAAGFVKEQLAIVNGGLSFAAVQTAYANGAATAHMRAEGVPVVIAKTGVKHLHHAALSFDVSVYFEANGHGTILFSPSAVSALLAAARSPPPRCDAARRLLCVRSLVNQAVGDALSDLLLVRALLARRWWGGAEWDALYTDLPSRQTKLLVADRGAVHTSQDEATATAPPGLQQGLDALATAAQHGRCFVRPSGTEDVVRVYAEAATQAAADHLALQAAQLTWRMAGGLGDEPTDLVA